MILIKVYAFGWSDYTEWYPFMLLSKAILQNEQGGLAPLKLTMNILIFLFYKHDV